jgi:hypothetical protein
MKIVLAALLLSLLATAASADTIWDYAGNSVNRYSQNPFAQPPPNPCGCSLNGSVELADAFTPVSWNFTAGTETYTQFNSTMQIDLGYFQTQPTFAWYLYIVGNDGSFVLSKFIGSITDAIDAGSMGLGVGSNEGVWSDAPVGTPEPSSIVLLAVGLAALLAKRFYL